MNIAFKNAIGGSRDMKVGVTSTQIGNANSCMQFGWIWLTSVETVVPSFFSENLGRGGSRQNILGGRGNQRGLNQQNWSDTDHLQRIGTRICHPPPFHYALHPPLAK